MNGTLEGKRIGVLESRMVGQLTEMMSRRGAEVIPAPALREQPVDASPQVSALIDGIENGDLEVFVMQTGVGVNALFETAARLGREDALNAAIRKTTSVARGPKPTAALRRRGIRPDVTVASPYTTAELIEAISTIDIEGRGVAVTHYGERNDALADALSAAAGRLHEVTLYEWMLPDDTTPLESIVVDLVERRLDAIAFTSQIQVRHLFQIAERDGYGAELAPAMRSTVVVAVGPTCARALSDFGVETDVMPDPPKMGHMVADLAEYLTAAEPNSQRATDSEAAD